MPFFDFSAPSLVLLAIFSLQVTFILYLKGKAIEQASPDSAKRKVRTIWNVLLLISFLFLAGMTFISGQGFFSVATLPPRFPLILLPHFAFLFWLLSLKVSGSLSFLQKAPPALLVAVQFFRFVLEFVILALHRQGVVPVEITYEGRSFDLWVGLSALLVGFLLGRNGKHAGKVGIAFHIFGLASLANIVFVAANSFPSPFQSYATNYLPAFFPGILIPCFIAPFAIYMHILSLEQLLHQNRVQKKPVLVTK